MSNATMDQANAPAVLPLPGQIGEQRPFWIEPPRTTADRIIWETFEQMAACGAEIEKRQGVWVRKLYRHDADRKTLGADGVLRVPRVPFYRRVYLTREAAMNGRGDFYMVDPDGALTLGRRGVWLRYGTKPEVDPGLYYQTLHKSRLDTVVDEDDVEWDAVSPAEQAAFSIEQERLARSTALTPVLTETPTQATTRRKPGRPSNAEIEARQPVGAFPSVAPAAPQEDAPPSLTSRL
jgi:hypothetical protein